MILVLTGPVHGGKSTFLERSLPDWVRRGLVCRGFFSPAAADAGGGRGYDLVEIGTGLRRPYLRREGEPGAERIGAYVFVPETLDRARSIIRDAGPSGVLVVDEVGPLELRGGGLWPALRDAFRRPDGTMLLVAREEILAELAVALAPIVPAVFDVRDPALRERLEARLFGKVESDDDQG